LKPKFSRRTITGKGSRETHEKTHSLLEHPGQGSQDLLPEASKHKLGPSFPWAWTACFSSGPAGEWNPSRKCCQGSYPSRSLRNHLHAVRGRHLRRKNRSFERLLLSPIPFSHLILAKTSGAVFFGSINALVPILLTLAFGDLGGINWLIVIPALFLIAVSSTFLSLFIAVTVTEVFEAQTSSNFFRFPMIFLCGLFFPVERLPFFLKPLSYALPLTYGADILRGGITGSNIMPLWADFTAIGGFCIVLFLTSLITISKKWIA
jgi:ABC-2 type transport system permease protein